MNVTINVNDSSVFSYFTVLPVTELESAVSRLASTSCPLDSNVKQLIHRSNLSKLVSIYQSVMIQKQNINSLTGTGSISQQQQPPSTTSVVPSGISSPPGTAATKSSSTSAIPSLNQSSCDLMQEIISILQEEVRILLIHFHHSFYSVDLQFQSTYGLFPLIHLLSFLFLCASLHHESGKDYYSSESSSMEVCY